MDRNKFLIKVNVVEDLLSAKSVFDKGAIGDIDGRSYFVNAFWFDGDLYIKYIEVAIANLDDSPESIFVVPAAAFVSGGILTLPRSGNFVKTNQLDHDRIGSELREKLFWISGRGLENEARAQIGEDDFLIRDFMIDYRNWKIVGVARGNWAADEITRISKIIGFDKNNFYRFEPPISERVK